MTIGNMQLDTLLAADGKHAAELAAFLEYAYPEIARLDAESAALLRVIIARLRSIADANWEITAPKH